MHHIMYSMSQKDMLEDSVVQRYINELVGPEGMQVALSPPEGEVTDEELAENLDLEVNTVRRTLIILSENSLADYRRVRDQDSGWLTYLWTFKYERIPEQLKEEMVVLRDKVEERLEFEQENQFYMCEVCRQRYTFDEAMDSQFVCHRCSTDLESMSSERLKTLMGKRLEDLNDELEKVNEA